VLSPYWTSTLFEFGTDPWTYSRQCSNLWFGKQYKKISILNLQVRNTHQGYGMILVSTFGRSQKSAIRKGFNDDIDTYLIVTGN